MEESDTLGVRTGHSSVIVLKTGGTPRPTILDIIARESINDNARESGFQHRHGHPTRTGIIATYHTERKHELPCSRTAVSHSFRPNISFVPFDSFDSFLHVAGVRHD